MSEETNDFKEQLEREARILAEQEEMKPVAVTAEPVTTLGKAEKFNRPAFDESELGADLGWKPVPLENLPSQGLFYEQDTQVAIRAATVAEIRHWSTLDENDLLGVDDMLNFIIEKCCRIKTPGKPVSYKDLKEIDRFYLIFAIRDYTFKNGENKMYVNVSGEDGMDEKIEVTKDVIDYFKADDRLMNYLDRSNQSFHIKMKSGEEFRLYLPTIGSMMFIKSYLRARQQNGQNFDKAFTKYAPFLFADWKTLSQASYEKAVQDSYTWSLHRISVMDKIVDILSSSIKPQIRYVSQTGGESTAPLSFPGGIKSIFLISDIFGELV
jgi:hypothetical protein